MGGLGAAFSAGAGLVGNAFDWMAGSQENKKNRNFSKGMWEKQNEYNLPINIRKRMEEGGFNPNIAMGNGTMASSTTAGAAAGAGGSVNTNFGEAGSKAVQAALTQAQIDNIKQNTEKTRVETVGATQDILNTSEGWNYNLTAQELGVEGQREANEQARITTENLNAQQQATIKNLNADYDRKLVENKYLPEQIKSQLAETNARITSLRISNAYAEAEKKTALNKAAAEIKLIGQNTQTQEAETRLKKAQATLREAGIEVSDNVLPRSVAIKATKWGKEYDNMKKNDSIKRERRAQQEKRYQYGKKINTFK